MRFIKKLIQEIIVLFFAGSHALRRIFSKSRRLQVGFLVEEFFHKDLRGFGGFGMTVKYLTDHFNTNGHSLKGDVFLTSWMNVPAPQIKRYHNADVILVPKSMDNYVFNFIRYSKIIYSRNIEAFISVDHYPSYEYQLYGFPNIPWIVWLKDPRDNLEWEKIATVSLEVKVMGKQGLADLLRMAKHQHDSINTVIEYSKRFNRKMFFATEAFSLVDIARRLYDLPQINPVLLPKPVPMPALERANFSQKPSFLFLGRIDPIKRPWIYFELAKLFPQADFYVAGDSHFKDIMAPVMAGYKDLPNLKLLGMVIEQAKHNVLNNIWATINTSVHEAVPVSFLETFAYGKPVISCQNPDNMTGRFGIYVGEVLGDGNDKKSIAVFAQAIEQFLSGKFQKEEHGKLARDYVGSVHTFENYEKTVRSLLEQPLEVAHP